MDPIAIAGLAVGVVPLIISALENWERTFQPLIIFTRDCQKEVKKFLLVMLVQKAAFRNSCQHLLCLTKVHQDVVSEMFHDLKHPLWQDASFDENLQQSLGSSFRACSAAVSLMQETLDQVVIKYGGLENLANRTKDESEKSFLNRAKRLRQRSKISFTKPDIDNSIKQLRQGNEDLERLLRQIDSKPTNEANAAAAQAKPNANFLLIQKALKGIHKGLSSLPSCTAEHTVAVSLGIQPKLDAVGEPPSAIDFTLVWTCRLDESPRADGALWLAVESQPEHIYKNNNDVECELNSGIQGQLRSAFSRVQIEGHTPSPPAPSRCVNSPVGPVPLIRNVCTDVRKQKESLAHREQQEDSRPLCFGLLQDSPRFRHLLFEDAGAPQDRTIISLAFALSQARTLLCGIPPVDRMRLAKTLSIAVLQLHTTPWLDREWRSEDVLFFGIKDLNKEPLQAPYLSSPLKVSVSGVETQSMIPFSSTFAPNRILYNLGILLIELAFERPLDDMKVAQDTIPGDPPYVALHRTAIRLADMIGKKLHVRYETVVKRCLWCNFGTNTELDSVDLQKAFYERVVCELDRCFQAAACFET